MQKKIKLILQLIPVELVYLQLGLTSFSCYYNNAISACSLIGYRLKYVQLMSKVNLKDFQLARAHEIA